jgi:hypothetical protein
MSKFHSTTDSGLILWLTCCSKVVAWGFFVALWTGVGESRWQSPNQWRLGFAIQSIPALLLGVGVLFVGESPRWLCLKGRYEEAEKAFRNYHFDGTNEEWCNTEFALIQENIREEIKAQGRLSWADLFKTPAFRKRLFVGSFVWAAAMLSGREFSIFWSIDDVNALEQVFRSSSITRRPSTPPSSTARTDSFS